MKTNSINNNIFNYLIYSLAILNVIFYLIYNLNIELIQFLLFVILGYLLSKRNIIFIIIIGVILINIILIDKIYNRKSIIEGIEGQDEDGGNNDIDPVEEARANEGAQTIATDAHQATGGESTSIIVSNNTDGIVHHANNSKDKILNVANP